MVLILPLISNSTCLFSKPWHTVPSIPTITGITVTFMLNSRPVGLGCRIHQLHLCRGVPPSTECPRYDIKPSDGEVPVILELSEMQSTFSLPSLPGPPWPGGVSPDRVLSTGQIELNCTFMLNSITWSRTVLIFKQCFYANLNCLK